MLAEWITVSDLLKDYQAFEADQWENEWRRKDQTPSERAIEFIASENTITAIKPDMLNKLRKLIEMRDLQIELAFNATANGALLRQLELDCACAGTTIRAEPNTLEAFVESRFDAGDIAEDTRDVLVGFLDSKTHDRFYWRIRRGLDDLIVLRKKRLRKGVRKLQH